MSLLSPTFWLCLVIWTAVVSAGSYLKGSKNAENAARAAHATALESAIATAKQNAVIDAQSLIDHERERQEVKTVFRDKIVTVEKLINGKNIPVECNIGDDAVGVFNSAIRAINSKTTPKHEPVPAAPPAPKREPARLSASNDSGH